MKPAVEQKEPEQFKGDPRVTALVSNSIYELTQSFERSHDKDTSPDTIRALNTLNKIQKSGILWVRVPGTHAISDIHEQLSPFAAEGVQLPYWPRDRFIRFIDDLEILSLFEKGGIEALNDKLDHTIKLLQQSDASPEDLKGPMNQANEIMMRAIYLFPHLVSGVEVALAPGAVAYTKKIDDKYSSPRRYVYERMCAALEAKGKTDNDTLVIPLPYGFSVGTHGSAQRDAMGASRMDVYFGMGAKREGYEPVPAVMVTVEAPLIVSNETMFLPREVNSIRLSTRKDYTPYFDPGRYENPIIEREHHVGYYLSFREFANQGTNRHMEEKGYVILEPHKFTKNLWRDDYLERATLLERGFFATYDDDPAKTVLYEVEDFILGGRSIDEHAVAAMMDNILKRVSGKAPLTDKTNPNSRFQKYAGDEIIDRLAVIPVAPRQF